MTFDDFHFAGLYWRESYWLFMLLLPILFVIIPYIKQQTIWQTIADEHLFAWIKEPLASIEPSANKEPSASIEPSANKEPSAYTQGILQSISKFLLSFAWLFLCLALAGPRTVKWMPPDIANDIVGVILLVDFSASMKTEDAFDAYTRINRIQQAENIIARGLKNEVNKNRHLVNTKMGLTVFSGQSHQILMPTSDQSLQSHFIRQLHLLSPPLLGNNLSSALQSSLDYHKQQTKKLEAYKQSHIVLFSDGDLGEKAIQDAEKVLIELNKQAQISLTIIGVGNSEASRIPVNKNTSIFSNDKVIVSRRESHVLKQLASGTHAKYYDAELLNDKKSISDLLHINQIRISSDKYSQVLWYEWFFIPLLVAFVFIVFALQIHTKKIAPVLVVLSMLFLLTACQSSSDAMHSQKQLKYQTAFTEGTQCYREKNYACAKNAFSYAAWLLIDKQYRGPAVFNLANSHFKLGDFDQASVLFQDAQLMGVDKTITQLNKSFADSMSLAVHRRIADILKTQQRAEWFAAARKLPEGFNELIADGLYLKQTKLKQNFIASFKTDEQQKMFKQLLERGLKRSLDASTLKGYSGANETSSKDFWVSSQQANSPYQTAQLLNHLMPIEAGLHYLPDEPVMIEGVRPW